MRISCLLIFFLFSALTAHAQTLDKSENYVINTPFVESDGRIVSVLHDDNIYLIGKIKGGNAQSSEYAIQRYNKELEVIWTIKKEFTEDDQLKGIRILNDQLILFWVTHSIKKRERSLQAEVLSLYDGSTVSKIELSRELIGPWKDVINKGQCSIGVQNTINSGNRKDLVTPLEYQYHIRVSKDASKLLTYAYDYSKQDLFINLKVFDANLKIINEAKIPVNRGFIHQDNIINDRGEIFIVNSKPNGLIAVIKYNIEERKSQYLEIEASNTDRGSFTARLHDSDLVYIGDLNTRNGRLVGISYSEFDFIEDKVGKIKYHPLSKEFKSAIDNARAFEHAEEDYEHWHYYQIADFKVLNDGSKVIMIEQQHYESRGYLFDPESDNNLSHWNTERHGELRVGDTFIFNFDEEDELLWYEPIFKHQRGNAQEGFNIRGFKSSISANYDINVIYELYGKAHHAIHYKKISADNGDLIIDTILENPDKLNVLLPFTTWMEDRVVLVGKKGFSGRTSKILLYKY